LWGFCRFMARSRNFSRSQTTKKAGSSAAFL
jgi:hypothetical protein